MRTFGEATMFICAKTRKDGSEGRGWNAGFVCAGRTGTGDAGALAPGEVTALDGAAVTL
jgi:hypothetical protein